MTLGDLQTLRREFMKIYELYEITKQQTLPNWTDLSRSICAKNTTGETMNFWQVLGFISSRSINHELHQAKNPPITLRACFLPTSDDVLVVLKLPSREHRWLPELDLLHKVQCPAMTSLFTWTCAEELSRSSSDGRAQPAAAVTILVVMISFTWFNYCWHDSFFYFFFYFQVLTRCCFVLRLTMTDHEMESFTSERRAVQTSVHNAIIVECPLAYQSP